MVSVKFISRAKLYWRKIEGCYQEFGVIETIYRTVRELIHPLKKPETGLDISLVTKDLAVGAVPRSLDAIAYLRKLGFSHVIDLRAERKQSDILAKAKDISVRWIPVYDDWSPKSPEFYQELEIEIKKVLLLEDGKKLFICCGAGEHRAPLAGVFTLVIMGYSLERAIAMVKEARPEAEFLPVYMSTLKEFLESTSPFNSQAASHQQRAISYQL